MTQIDTSLYLSSRKNQGTGSSTLGKDDFLKILMTQLQNQSPSDPMKDKEFISQMATFSSLEQMMSISGSVDKLVQQQAHTPVVEYSHLIGKEVEYKTKNDNGEIQTEGSGTVSGIAAGQDGTEIILQNEKRIPVHSIIEVRDSES